MDRAWYRFSGHGGVFKDGGAMIEIKDYIGEMLHLSMQGEIVATYQVKKDDVEISDVEFFRHRLTCVDESGNLVEFVVDQKKDIGG